MKGLHGAAFVLLIIGGLNWLLEAFNTGLGYWLSGGLAQIIYILIGVAAVYELFTHKRNCKACGKQEGGAM